MDETTCERAGCLNAEHHDLSGGDYPPYVESDVQALVNDLANRYEEAGHRALAAEARVAELEEELRIGNEAFLVLLERCARAERELGRTP